MHHSVLWLARSVDLYLRLMYIYMRDFETHIDETVVKMSADEAFLNARPSDPGVLDDRQDNVPCTGT
jgi:hypothetical protein